ncbi:MAG: hypothetical protein H6826_14320 [Planctomycetes bacterium]|nr:hypothetical protein [Planctomycetota bacterium]
MTAFSGISVCAQLCRHWSANTAWPGGLDFLDPDTTAVASTGKRLFARQAPEAGRRGDPCAAVTPEPGGGENAYDAFRRYGVLVSAFGTSPDDCMALLEDLREVLRPGHRPLVYTGPAHGGVFGLGGILGAPSLSPGDDPRRVLRVREVQEVSAPQLVQAHLAAGGIAPDLAAVAQMRVELGGTLDDLPAPLPAFTVHVGSGDGAALATVQVLSDRVRISWDTDALPPDVTSDFLFATHTTVGALRAAIDASGEGDYVVTVVDAGLDGRTTATDLFTLTETSCLGPGQAQPITVRP